MPTVSQSKNLLLIVACAVAAYLSFTFFGGYLVFGFRNLAEFCLIGVPMFALPIALLGFRYARLSSMLWLIVIVLFFGIQLQQLGPPFSRVLHNGTQFFKFVAVALLLAGAAVLEHFERRKTLLIDERQGIST